MAAQRNTNQRIKILEHLTGVKTHPTAEMVYNAVKKDLPAISLATVYRNLNNLADEGSIVKLEINGEFRFDGDVCSHQHCICRKCGKVMDVFHKEISEYAMKKIRSRYFEPSCVNIMFTGFCRGCRPKTG
ncbi:transcriptional repressor [Candidatus Woesearchaeota archaeon]|nr:transcriptional repressor [Candidatus Woesearchaeota archaeon]